MSMSRKFTIPLAMLLLSFCLATPNASGEVKYKLVSVQKLPFSGSALVSIDLPALESTPSAGSLHAVISSVVGTRILEVTARGRNFALGSVRLGFLVSGKCAKEVFAATVSEVSSSLQSSVLKRPKLKLRVKEGYASYQPWSDTSVSGFRSGVASVVFLDRTTRSVSGGVEFRAVKGKSVSFRDMEGWWGSEEYSILYLDELEVLCLI
jgi:hypothetical protein